jgi:hypothetical protein
MVHFADDEARGGGQAVQVKISGDRPCVFSPRADDIFLRVTDIPSHVPAPIAHLYAKSGDGCGVNILRMRVMCKPRTKQNRRKEKKN